MGLANKKIVFISALLAGWLTCPLVGFAQDTGGGEASFVPSPRNNVKIGAIESRRPGTWTNASIGRHSQRQTTILKEFGGAEPVSESQLPTPRKQVLLTAFLQSLFDNINNILDQYMLLLKSGNLFGSDNSSTSETETPEPV